jgi:hypothetical protein
VRPTDGHGEHLPPQVAGGVCADALAIIHDAQPYQFGTDYAAHPLWMLNELWNIDKHRHVAMRGARIDGFLIEAGTPRFSYTVRTISFNEYGAEIALVPDNPTVHPPDSTIRVMVHEPGPGIEISLYEVLKEARTAVTTLVTSCEEACF